MSEVLPGTSEKTGGGPLAIKVYRCMIPISHIGQGVRACVWAMRGKVEGKLGASNLEECLNVPGS